MSLFNRHKAWFTPIRGSYIPANGAGVIVYLLYAGYIVTLAIGWYAHGHEAWSLLTETIPLTVGAALITQYIASKHSR